MQTPDRHDGFDNAIEHPGKGVQGRYKDIEERQGGEHHLCCELVTQEDKEAKGEEAEEQAGGSPEVDTKRVQVFASCQSLHLALASFINLGTADTCLLESILALRKAGETAEMLSCQASHMRHGIFGSSREHLQLDTLLVVAAVQACVCWLPAPRIVAKAMLTFRIKCESQADSSA